MLQAVSLQPFQKKTHATFPVNFATKKTKKKSTSYRMHLGAGLYSTSRDWLLEFIFNITFPCYLLADLNFKSDVPVK